MWKGMWVSFLAGVVCSLAGAGTPGALSRQTAARAAQADASGCAFKATGSNFYFVLLPGHRLQLGAEEGGKRVRLTMTVLQETKKINGVETRAIEERLSVGGDLVSIRKKYYAVCEPRKDVYYFGEEVEHYKNAKVVGNAGSWMAGANGAQPGMAMPGAPRVGMTYTEGIPPGMAMTHTDVVSITEMLKTEAGEFHDVMRVEEASEAGKKETKYFAPGLGLAKVGKLELASFRSAVM